MTESRGRWLGFGGVVAALLALDVATKAWALAALEVGEPTRYLGGFLPITLHFNTGGLWGLGSGRLSRWFFLAATVVALVVLVRLYRGVDRTQLLRRLTIPLIAAGALGNMIDRLRWDRGVVDFIGPVDLGFMEWPIFNVADMAISCSTVLLMISLWRNPPAEASAEGETEGDSEGNQAAAA